jgi:hypothetical protein
MDGSLEKLSFKSRQLRSRIFAKAQLLASALLSSRLLSAQGAPRLHVVENQFICGKYMQVCGECGLYPHRSMHN